MTKNRMCGFKKKKKVIFLLLSGQWEESTDKWLGRNRTVIEELWSNAECFLFIFNT